MAMTINKSATNIFSFERNDSTGAVILTAPDNIFFTVKRDARQEVPILQKTMQDMVFDSATGEWSFTIEADETELLIHPTYVYDLVVAEGAEVYRIDDEEDNIIEVVESVTHLSDMEADDD